MNNLKKFIDAQEQNYERALKEIQNGKKLTHWIWYIFPQIKGLGFSDLANYYGIANLDEAKAYLSNDYLRNNLLEITNSLLNLKSNNIREILDYPDNLKVKSCMTLFYYANPNILVFKKVIDKYYDGNFDNQTISLLKQKKSSK